LLTTLILFIQLLLEIRNYFYITDYQGALCIVLSLATYPLQQTVYVMILVYFIRYFTIINMNETKNDAFTKIQAKINVDISEIHRIRIRFFKIISSHWFAIGFIITSYILSAIVFIITTAIGSVGYPAMTCTFETLNAMNIINNVELIIIYGLTVLTLLGDAISNYKFLIQCKWIEYFFYRDPYWFRAQILLFMPFMVFSTIVGCLSLANINYGDIVNSFVATVILNTIQAAIFFTIDVLFPLAITIVTIFKRLICKDPKVTDHSGFVRYFQNSDIEKAFIEFSIKEFSIENYSCWKDIQDWKDTANKHRKNFKDAMENLREDAITVHS
jgi:hypothetical protein